MLLPLGCKLRPSDEELISGFLKKHVAGEPLEAPLNELVLVDSDNQLGRTEPWVLWAGFQWHHLTEQHLYFFSKMRTTSAKSGKVNRKIEPPGGTWRGSHCVDVNDDDGNCIGLKRFLRYEKKECDESGKWLLEEYSVPEAPLSVLCRLKRGPKICGVGIKRKTTCCSDEQEQLNLQNKKKMPSSKNKKARHQELNLESGDPNCSHDDGGVMVGDQESRPPSPNNVPAGPPQVIEETWSHHINNSPVEFDHQDYTISNMGEYLATREYEYGGGGGSDSVSYGGFQASTSTGLEDCIIPPPQSPTPPISRSYEPEERLCCDYVDQFLGTSAEAEPSSYYPALVVVVLTEDSKFPRELLWGSMAA